jgi:NAD(P)H-flavin reductase/ferredoxin
VWDKLFRRGPSEFTMHIAPSDTDVKVQSTESLLQAALKQGLAFPYNCRVGGCGQCKCKLVSGKVKELTDKSYLLSAEELKANFILACQSQPRSDVVVEVALRPAVAAHPVVETGGRITAMERLTGDIMRVALQLDEAMAYTAGQYAEFVVPAGTGAPAGTTRQYSFASAPDASQPQKADFFIRKVPGGVFTEWLFGHAQVGMALTLRGPQGQFGLRPGTEPMLCLAGGSGLAPIKAVLEQAIADQQSNRPLVILFGARTQADLYGLDDIDQIRRQWSGRFRFEPVLSAEPEGSNWKGLRGMLAEHLAPILGDHLDEYAAWMCGPPPMIDACTATLQQGGVPAERIHADKFLDASYTAAAGKAA